MSWHVYVLWILKMNLRATKVDTFLGFVHVGAYRSGFRTGKQQGVDDVVALFGLGLDPAQIWQSIRYMTKNETSQGIALGIERYIRDEQKEQARKATAENKAGGRLNNPITISPEGYKRDLERRRQERRG